MKFVVRRMQVIASIALCAVSSAAALGQADPQTPHVLRGVDIVEKLDAQLPLDTSFVNTKGETIKLGDLFESGRPVILQIGYYKCPQLCNLVLNEMTQTLQTLGWTTGQEFDVISVSINPEETYELAAAKRTSYILMYDRRKSGSGWHFLTGSEASSRAVADAVGFNFAKQPDGEFAHAAGLFIITPDGRVARYLYGAGFDTRTLRFALLEASEGRIGSTLDRFILWCHVYDPDSGSYVLFAVRVMQIGGILTLIFMTSGVIWMWRADRRRSAALNHLSTEATLGATDCQGGPAGQSLANGGSTR